MKRLRVLTSIALLRRLQCLEEKGRERERGREGERKRGREREREYKINKPLLYDMIRPKERRGKENNINTSNSASNHGIYYHYSINYHSIIHVPTCITNRMYMYM